MGSHVSFGPGALAIMNALRRIVRFLRLADREAEGAVGLSAAQLFVLQSLWAAPADSLAELAERTLTDQSSVSTVVAKLVAKRLVTRRPAAGDRRRAELRLTAAGEHVVRTAPRVPQVRLAEALRAMSATRRDELVRSLEVLAIAIGAEQTPPSMLFEDDNDRARKSSSRGRRR